MNKKILSATLYQYVKKDWKEKRMESGPYSYQFSQLPQERDLDSRIMNQKKADLDIFYDK